jgi:hypothetical protein
MQLLFVHQVLIGMAVWLAGIFAIRSFWMFKHTHAPLDLAMAAAAIVTGALLYLYFKSVREKWRAQQKSRPQRRE